MSIWEELYAGIVGWNRYVYRNISRHQTWLPGSEYQRIKTSGAPSLLVFMFSGRVKQIDVVYGNMKVRRAAYPSMVWQRGISPTAPYLG